MEVPADCAEVLAMPQTQTAKPLRILGALVGTVADRESEFTAMIAKAWVAYHSEAVLWRTRGSLAAKFRILHLSVFACFSWASGTRH